MIAFVRHGQTAVNRDGRLQGRARRAADDAGRRAGGAAAARRSRPSRSPRVVASPLRARAQTAAAIAARHGLDVEVDDRLIELDYGEWDGVPLGDLTADGSGRRGAPTRRSRRPAARPSSP